MKRIISAWQLPRGVSSGTWDYVETEDIATSYDDYFRQHGMFRLDEEVVGRYVGSESATIDLGCGTGRALMPLLRKGVDCVACDLSQAMLVEVERNARELIAEEQLDAENSVLRVRANLVDLDCFRNNSFDSALCLFSTLGMIRGSDARREFLNHVSRIVSPGGHFILQVHNYWAHLFDPDGPWWMLSNAVRAWWKGDVQIGDRFFPYRGIPKMYLHSFSYAELGRLLAQSDFEIIETIPLNSQQNARLARPKMGWRLRASGWIVVARLDK